MYVVVADIGHYKPEELVNCILAYYKRYKCVKFGFEANNFQGLFVKDLMNRAKEQGFEPNIIPIKNTAEKVKRILTLQPWLKSGAIKLSSKQGLLLEEARYFPRGKHDDGLDALEMAVRLSTEHNAGEFDIFATDKKDIQSNLFDEKDYGDREYLDWQDDDEDGPSPNAKEIKFFT
jgi:predicted phage terminase large subunit-like protein